MKRKERIIEKIIFREPKVSDIMKLYKMYTLLSEETKKFFHPFPERILSVSSLFTWIPLALSCIRSLRKALLKIMPFLVYISICSVYSSEVIGFAYIRLRNKFYGSLGIVVRDGFQGLGIGSKMLHYLIILARKEGLKKIRLTVLADNYRAIKLYEKFRFKRVRFIKGGDTYKGKRYDCIEMILELC